MATFVIKNSDALASDEPAIEEMRFPYRCLRCYGVHDVATVTIIQRYQDCTLWRCPDCQSTIDDRPEAWGGSAERIY